MNTKNTMLARARAGDAAATAALVRALQPRISRMATHYARRSGECGDDLQQEAWVAVLDALPELQLGMGAPEQYLIQCARWRMLDAIKRARVRRCLPWDEAVAACKPDLQVSDCYTSLDLADISDGLTTKQQQILRHLLRGLTWREAGDALGCTSANVAYHIRQIQRRYRAWDAETV